MADFDDFDLDKEKRRRDAEPERERNVELERDTHADEGDLPLGELPPELRRPGSPPIVWIALALVAALAGVLFVLRPAGLFRSAEKPAALAPPRPSIAPLATATPPPAPGVDLPPLEESDSFVRDQARNLSTHPQLAAWLAAQGLVRTLTVSVQNVAEGRSPAPFLGFLVPSPRFGAVQKAGRMVADPASYAAYDGFADGIAALDAAECARVYRLLQPLFGAAYAELGYPAAGFPKALARAFDTVRETPVPDEIALRKGPVFLELADPRLEALNFAQKQLLRMGPRNLRLIKGKVGEVAAALEPPATPPASPAP
jgi:hypothetical protein